MKKMLAILLSTLFLGCQESEISPSQIYRTWYVVGVFDHREDYSIDYHKLDFKNMIAVDISEASITSNTSILEFRSQSRFIVESVHPDNLSFAGKIEQKNALFKLKSQATKDATFATLLKNSDQFYLNNAYEDFFQINLSSKDLEYKHIIMVRSRGN
jgi:hypothetical protein